ncbi:MAG: hypothetical protein JW739_05825 [Opitutales bacterium]|nr:hypothetical protein [Opitutales bacterium]
MFSIEELRLIRCAIAKLSDDYTRALTILDPESEDSIGITNDLALLEHTTTIAFLAGIARLLPES